MTASPHKAHQTSVMVEFDHLEHGESADFEYFRANPERRFRLRKPNKDLPGFVLVIQLADDYLARFYFPSLKSFGDGEPQYDSHVADRIALNDVDLNSKLGW